MIITPVRQTRSHQPSSTTPETTTVTTPTTATMTTTTAARSGQNDGRRPVTIASYSGSDSMHATTYVFHEQHVNMLNTQLVLIRMNTVRTTIDTLPQKVKNVVRARDRINKALHPTNLQVAELVNQILFELDCNSFINYLVAMSSKQGNNMIKLSPSITATTATTTTQANEQPSPETPNSNSEPTPLGRRRSKPWTPSPLSKSFDDQPSRAKLLLDKWLVTKESTLGKDELSNGSNINLSQSERMYTMAEMVALRKLAKMSPQELIDWVTNRRQFATSGFKFTPRSLRSSGSTLF